MTDDPVQQRNLENTIFWWIHASNRHFCIHFQSLSMWQPPIFHTIPYIHDLAWNIFSNGILTFINQWLYIHWVIGLARNPIQGPDMEIHIGSRPDTAFWPDYFFPISQTIISSGRGYLVLANWSLLIVVFPNTIQKNITTIINIRIQMLKKNLCFYYKHYVNDTSMWKYTMY